MKKIAAAILATASLTALAAQPAQARTTAVAPITCGPAEDTCSVAFIVNGGAGYWVAKRDDGGTWVRLTLVPFWDNSRVAPITCRYASSCVLDFYNGYWMARQASGSTWVRLTLLP